MSQAHEYAQQHHDRFVEQLQELVRIPSVSTLSQNKPDMAQAANWLAEDMKNIGFDRAEVMPTNGHPVVYGEWKGAGEEAPTVLVYGHYDVQPAEMADGWSHEPFDPHIEDGFLYGRGAMDNKGQLIAQLKAIESLIKTGGSPVNLKVIFEGEEETSSINLPVFVQEHIDMLSADVCVISDTGMREVDQPQMCYSLRGLTYMELHVTGPSHDLHSGSGHTIHNPAQALAEIIAKLHDEDGRITVPGFYDDVAELDAKERALMNEDAPTEEYVIKTTGSPTTWGEPNFTPAERMGARPTLEVNGMVSGFYGEGSKTVIPAKAMAKLSARLVANQKAQRAFEQIRDYIAEITPPSVRSELKLLSKGEPAYTAPDTPSMQAAVRAYEQGWGKAPTFNRGGGSIPIVADFQQMLNVPVVLLGFGVGDGVHGPNERFLLEAFKRGVDTAIYFYEEVGKGL
ncbi:MAG: dipeptidase [Anaerolineae bacterium]|nr:dipeptidase [Anaerolineae bacterium]